jgi:outer membrane protein insertion porin family
LGVRVAALLIVAVVLLFAPPRLAGAQSGAGSNGPIAAIEVVGNQRIEAATVRSYMRIDVGEPYDPLRIDDSLKVLFATGLFADVSIRRRGDVLVVDVVENPIINRLAFEGNRRIEDKTLAQEVRLRPRVVYTRSRVQADLQRILQVYRRNGRFAVTVEPKVIQLEQNRVDLVFEISEGEVTGIRRIDFIGNKRFDDSKLRSAIATKETRWYRFFSSDDTYDPDRLTLDRELLRKFYLERGYADFRVVSAVAELTQDRSDFFVTFTVDEGEKYQFGKIDISSNLPNLDIEGLRASLASLTDTTYNAEEIEKSIENLTFAVGKRGYAFVDIRPRVERNRENRTIDIVYEIDEGPRVYVERINIVGNVRTLDKVIRREMLIVEGDAFNTAKIRRSRQQIRRLGFFDKIDITQEQGSAPDNAVLNVEVQERSTGELSFGVGISSAEAVVGDVSIRERNLLGRGQDLKVGASLSPSRQQVDIAFTEPYFLDRNVAAGFDVFNIQNDRQDRSSFDEVNTGLRLRSRFSITENLRQAVNYTIRQDEISGVGNSTSPLIRRDEGTYLTSSVGYELIYDTRDDTIRPNSGVLIRGGQNVAGFGGDIKYVRSDATWSYFYPFTDDLVGNFALKGGHIVGINQDVRVTDRYFIGGGSFRGFEAGGIGPRDPNTADAIGGTAYFVATSEMRFPLGLPNELGVVGRAFSEVGTLTDADVSGFAIQDEKSPRLTAGLGMSWLSPFGPIQVDFAQALVKEKFDKEELFRFSFGTRF